MDNSTTARPIRTIAQEIQYEWGYKVNYPTPLSEQDIKAYELEFVGQRTRHSKETP